MRRSIFVFLLLWAGFADAGMFSVKLGNLVTNQTTTGTGSIAGPATAGRKTFQGTVTGSGSVSATIAINVSNDKVDWITLGTITLSGTNAATDGFATEASWGYYQANVSALSGTGASVTVVSGQE